jgi:hypothetical protein
MGRELYRKRNVWKVKDNIILDNNGHAINHCGYILLQKVLEKIDFDKIGQRAMGQRRPKE